MKIIGITGGVGSGKSEVMAYLEKQYRAAALRADDVGHRLIRSGGICYDKVLSLFGREAAGPDGELNRSVMAERVFRDPGLREKLNGIIHPAVRTYILHAIEEERAAGRRFFFLEAALLIEEKYDEICDELWYVYAEEAVRRDRLKAGRRYSEEKIRRIMESQLSEEEFRKACSFVIDNSRAFSETVRQIDQRMKRYEIM
jgi:dephospho-CoA kinase